MGWPDILDMAAKVGEAVAVFALAFLFWEHHKREQGKDITEWQKVKVFNIIVDRGPITESDIRGHYLDDVKQNREVNLGPRDISPRKISAIVLDLLENKAIFADKPGPDERPGILYSPVILPRTLREPPQFDPTIFYAGLMQGMEGMRTQMEGLRIQMAVDERQVMQLIRANSGKFNEAEVLDHFSVNNQIPHGRLTAVLLGLQRSHLIMADSNGKLRAVTVRPQDPPKPGA